MRVAFFLLFLLIILTGCHSGYHRGPLSDHFNGQHFYNPQHHPIQAKRSLTLIFKQEVARHRATYPLPTYAVKKKLTIKKYTDEITITFINHATMLIQSKTINILTDPIWSYRASPFSWIGPARLREPGVLFEDLPPIDIVIISHSHYDHLDLPTLEKLNAAFHPVFIVPLGNKVFLERYNIRNVVELDWWQQDKIGSVTITALPAEHWSARWLHDVNRTLWASYGIEINHRKIYFAGDTAYASHFSSIKARWGEPDVALLPIGAYEPRSVLKSVHIDPKEAVKAYEDLGARYAIGMHYGTFQLSSESLWQPELDLDKALREARVTHAKFLVLPQGGSWVLK